MTTNQLALLIAGPQPGEAAMFNDMAAMAQALQERGLPADQIRMLHGHLDRPLVLAFLESAARQVSSWADGTLFVHYSGHGFFTGETADEARSGLLFADGDESTAHGHLFWDDFFDALTLPDWRAAHPPARPVTLESDGRPCAGQRRRHHYAGGTGHGTDLSGQ